MNSVMWEQGRNSEVWSGTRGNYILTVWGPEESGDGHLVYSWATYDQDSGLKSIGWAKSIKRAKSEAISASHD